MRPGGRRAKRALVALGAAATLGGCGDDRAPPDPGFVLVGESDLGGRGGHAAIALAGDVAYVGARIDAVAAAEVGATADVLIVDLADPAAPAVVGALGPPEQGLAGMSARELRALPDLDLLVILNLACSEELHGCGRDFGSFPRGVAERDNLKLYDIADRLAPRHLATLHATGGTLAGANRPHELFLWRDPARPERVLALVSTPPGPPGLHIYDLTRPDAPALVIAWDPIADGGLPEPRSGENILHSVGASRDGRVAYLSHQLGGLFLADLSAVTGSGPPALAPLGALDARADWAPPEPVGPHSAVEVPGRDLLVVTDEIYPPPFAVGCPWGWMRVVDIADPGAPRVAGELRLPENDPAACAALPDDVTFTAHNATATASLALVSWHEAGLVAVDLADPEAPRELTRFAPEPRTQVAHEDPALGRGGVAMWSTPVIDRGLIYVVDVRNGLYVLRYEGPHADEIALAPFAEGSSSR
jgi:hypothetical protein